MSMNKIYEPYILKLNGIKVILLNNQKLVKIVSIFHLVKKINNKHNSHNRNKKVIQLIIHTLYVFNLFMCHPQSIKC